MSAHLLLSRLQMAAASSVIVGILLLAFVFHFSEFIMIKRVSLSKLLTYLLMAVWGQQVSLSAVLIMKDELLAFSTLDAGTLEGTNL